MKRNHQQSISINLLPVDPEASSRKLIGLGFVLLLLLTVGGIGFHYQSARHQQTALQEEQVRLQQQLASLQGNLPTAGASEEREKQLAALRQKVKAVEQRQMIASPMLDEIEASMVAGTVLKTIKIEGTQLQLVGTADNHSQVAGCIANLMVGSRFSGLSNLDASFDEGIILQFTLQMQQGGTSL